MSHPDTSLDDEHYMTGGARVAVLRINRSLHILIGATVFLYLAAVVLVLIVFSASKKQHDALCDLRQDRQRQVDNSRSFLREHPRGIPGITPSQIQQGIDIQQATVDALEPLGCQDAEPTPTTSVPAGP